MTSLTRATRRLSAAPIDSPNPLPPLFSGWDIHQVEGAGDADEEMLAGARYGRVSSVLPYLDQDSYGRDRTPAEVDVVVLENERLRAEFLLGMGGRLWSLEATDPATGVTTELLHRNELLQPAHFALRNAWVAGGVEWNIGTIGHTVLTAEPLHTARVRGPDGEPVIRMYEYERLRGVVYQVDAWLPAGSAVLAVHVRIVNPTDADVPMYWWSNIAVPENDDVRVLAPADAAWKFDYSGIINSVPVPVPAPGRADLTYSARAHDAADYFFDVTATSRPWIAAVDGTGSGLGQVSTSRLQGRKLFLWGSGRGGQHWQEWLSGPGAPYLEIQAGLARTQLEHLRMPPGASWQWVEAYGPLHTDPAVSHGRDWAAAREQGESAIQVMLGGIDLEEVLERTAEWVDAEPIEVIEAGSGWGALRQRLMGGRERVDRPGTPFTAGTLGADQRDWVAVLEGARDWSGDPSVPPRSYQVDQQWDAHLAEMTGWQALLHRGVLAAARDEPAAAEDFFRRSLEAEPTAWAWRHLARVLDHRGRPEEAADCYRRALALVPEFLPLLREGLDALLAVGAHDDALDRIDALPADLRRAGRIRLAEARAAVGAGRLDRAGALLADLEVPDLQEGDTVLTDLWIDYRRARGDHDPGAIDIPRHLDFRMKTDPAGA
ncbi:DUF5107 domain-containing protein [Pseudactinotalea sp. HY160]|uniref:DUF5107 domain-containing protein n=1 Tax=Pseudactinotalea sp. HY160 TaxID=2654490 RepID=UPI00128B4D5C|nr:DUF5107 domain-containing protein [Pseudactinotalea sp. HY160]MPV49339.1 DUF5107 domain-containing protein [Pseudactinotalea sp. HY160]